MLGCDWGTKVGLPRDREVCTRQARHRMALHGPEGQIALKVCQEHALAIELQTDAHAGGT